MIKMEYGDVLLVLTILHDNTFITVGTSSSWFIF
jgi:hypothetical protein